MSVLFIGDLFPPDPTGRAEKIFRHVKYLKRYGIDVNILCPATVKAPYNHGVGDLGVTCYRLKPWFHKHLMSLKWYEDYSPNTEFGRLYLKLRLPAGYARWVVKAFFFAKKIIEEKSIEIIVAESNPISCQLLGVILKEKYPTIQYVAELRDPVVGYYRSRHSEIIHRKVESLIMEKADCIIEWKDFSPRPLIERWPEAKRKYHLIENVGFDPEEYVGYEKTMKYDRKFRIIYTGKYYGEKVLWELFFDALNDSVAEGMSVRFDYYGHWDDVHRKIVRKYPELRKNVFENGLVTKEVCIEACQKSNILLFVLAPNEENIGRVTSKLYDYFASKRPMLSLVPEGGIVEDKIREFCPDLLLPIKITEIGEKSYNEYKKKLKMLLKMAYEKWKEQKMAQYVKEEIGQYSCETSEKVYAGILGSLL